MTECCNPMTGKCEQGPGCPVRETPTALPIHFAGPEPEDETPMDGLGVAEVALLCVIYALSASIILYLVFMAWPLIVNLISTH